MDSTIEFAKSLTYEMLAYMLMAIIAAFAGSKLFKRFKTEISPREYFMWFAWTGMLIIIVVFTVYLNAPIPAIKAVWSVLSGLLVARFITEDKSAEILEEARSVLNDAKMLHSQHRSQAPPPDTQVDFDSRV